MKRKTQAEIRAAREEKHKERQKKMAKELEEKKRKHFMRRHKQATKKAEHTLAIYNAKPWTPSPVVKSNPKAPTIIKLPSKDNPS